MEHQFREAFADGSVLKLQAYSRVDSRICTRCGARAGQCEHLKSEADVVWLTKPSVAGSTRIKWEPQERERFANFAAMGLSNKQIAEAMNKTEGAIAGLRFRMANA